MDSSKLYSVSNYIASLDTVALCSKDETFGSALSLVRNSHTAVYVMEDKTTLLGLVVPYQARFQHHFPYLKRVSSDLLIPPSITELTPLYEVAEHMVSSRVYNLPVFTKDGKLIGPVHAKDILLGITQDRDLLEYVSQTVSFRKPITAPSSINIEDAYNIFKKNEISRIILVRDEGVVSGIITRSDILRAFIHPTEKQRFSKKIGDSGYYAFDEEKIYRKDEPVRKYATEMVESINEEKSIETTIQKLIFSKYNSLVIVDSYNKPIGFISLKDILQTVTTLRPKEESVPIILQKPSTAVSQKDFSKFKVMLENMEQKIQRSIQIGKIEVTFDEPKYPDGKAVEYKTTIIVTPLKGEKLIAKSKHPVFMSSISDAISDILRQEEKREINRFEYQDRYTSI